MFQDESPIKVIVPIKFVPDGEVITKRTGTARYTVQREIRIFTSKVTEQTRIKAKDGVVFYTKGDGTFNAMSEGTEVVWVTTWGRLQCHVYENQ